MNNFHCFVTSPIESKSSSNLAIATLKANGIHLFNTNYCSVDQITHACQNLVKVRAKSLKNNNIGIIINAHQINKFDSLLQILNSDSYWLVLSHWQDLSLLEIITSLPKNKSRNILLQLNTLEQLKSLEKQTIKIDGIIAKGNESGGEIGDDSTLVLTQKLLKNTDLPVYVQGGISKNTAAGCRAIGAAGVVLNEELLLMPESYFPQDWQIYLQNLTGQEALTIGENINQPIRVLKRPQFQAVNELEKLAQEAQRENQPEIWQNAIAQLVGWNEPGVKAWPMGQGVGLAQQIREEYHTTGRFIQAIINDTKENIELSKKYQSLGVNSPLAKAHKTKYPIVQGPMTRVSDRATFAQEVATAGGLPLLALALMKGQQVDELLTETKALLGNKSWGIGILGFVPQKVRQEQLAVVKRVKPPFALIAGGRPDQAAELESEGITTYLHVPNLPLLQMYIEQGARHFVFEGRECGGHIGPLSSFVLWETVITFISQLPPQIQGELNILFAGGIHDATSGTMVTVMTSPLAKAGVKIGVLMGSAYLFTSEAVTSGAILPQFQQEAIKCTVTKNLQTSPGHVSRCADTPFVKEFCALRGQMLAENRTAGEIKDTLESMTLGRLRIATKGIIREGNQLNKVDESQQISQGMYMLGQVATMHDSTLTIEQLHQNVSEGSTELISNLQLETPKMKPSQPLDIAIVGMSTLLPSAQNPETFWDNILRNVNGITEIPPERWDWRLYYSSDRREQDKIYSKWGGFLADLPFEPLKFGIPPKSLKSIEPMQLLALEAVRRALIDAGTAYEKGDFEREETCVILGGSGGMGDLGQQYATRSEIPRMVGNPDEQVWERLPEWTEESFPGLLMNVMAGRVANRFDLGGTNFTVDAACASSLTAVDMAVQQLVTGRAKVAIAGGVDTIQSPFGYFCFSKTQALSPSGQVRSFDQAADGIVISEGVAMVVLKPLADAQKDGDRIYAVIKGIGSSSDGKGLSLTAPASSGQEKAFLRAYNQAGFSPSTLGLYEAHGTGTVAGDRAELTTITNLLRDNQAQAKSCVLGSVKTMIGHTKSTAGIAGLIKVALSLHYRVLPNHRNVENPLPEIKAEDSPLYLLKSPKPWIAHPDYPRRGGVSAFGFGGTNFHAVLEEYQGETEDKVLGTSNWNCELIVIASDSKEKLTAKINNLAQALADGAKPCLKDLAYSYALDAQPLTSNSYTATTVVHNLLELEKALVLILEQLSTIEDKTDSILEIAPHTFINLSGESQRQTGKIAFLFPGQVAQYPNMGAGVALCFPEMQNAIAKASKLLKGKLPKLLSQYLFPPSYYSEEEEAKAREEISETHVAQSCLAAVELGYFDLVTRLGIKPDFVAGHSYGEYAALMASGVISPEDFIILSEARGSVMSKACEASDGAMAVVKATRDKLAQEIQDIDDVMIANHNAPLQTVISGKTVAVTKVVDNLKQADVMAKMLPVTGAFHSHLVASAQQALNQVISGTLMNPPSTKVYSNVTAKPYPHEVEEIKNLLSQHLLSMVEFVNQIKNMYADGARIFVEVGPKNIISNLVKQILGQEDSSYTTIPLDGQGRGLRAFLTGLSMLVNYGVNFDLMALFQHRNCKKLNLNQLKSTQEKLPANAWLLNGGSIRHQKEKVGYTGKIAPLNHKNIDQSSPEKIKTQPLVVTNGEKSQSQLSLNEKGHDLIKNGNNGNNKNHNFTKVQSSNCLNPCTNQQSHHSNLPSNPIKSMNQQQPQPQPQPFITQDSRLAAYQSYQETMRQFLGLQEKVMGSFLTGNSATNHSANGNVVDSPSVSGATPLPLTPTHSPQISSFPTTNSVTSDFPSPPVSQPIPTVENNSPTTVPPVVASPQQSALIHQSQEETITRANLIEIIVGLVSDRTGYPPEMLGLEQDLEAELGIDSIKRVEIFGALQKALPEKYANQIKAQMETITQVKTLTKLADLIINESSEKSNNNGSSNHISNGGNNHISSENQIIIFDENYFRKTLLNLVSERTGYPEEMLGLEQDLEAELGIDSIKRVEILGALPKILPDFLAEKLTKQMETLTKVKTLKGLIDLLTNFTKTESLAGGEINGVKKSELLDNVVVEQKCDRYLMVAKPQPLSRINIEQSEKKLTGLFLITEGDKIVTNRLKNNLEKLGAKTAVIAQENLINPETIKERIEEIKKQREKITGLIHLTSLDFFPTPENLSQWQQLAQIQAKSLFQILKHCSDDLQKNNGKVIATSLMGGYWGRNKQLTPGLTLGGSHNGLLKTMMVEWKTVKAKVIDFDHNSFIQAPSTLIQELIQWDENIEIGYANKERFIFDIVNQPVVITEDNLFKSKPYFPQSDWIVLSIGGARGITAEIVKEVVKANMTLILVGRSAIPSPENEITKGIDDINSLKKILIQQALEKREKPLPVEIDKQIEQLQRNRSILENLNYFQQQGVKVEYHSLDVRDEEQFGSFINNLYDKYGKIDAVIQGAGIIQDKLIIDKTLTSFDQVFHTKVDSTFILSKYLRPESLKLLVLFASIAGRTGNIGQVDYAAGNEVINRMAWRMRQLWPNTKIISINWGPWDVTGMASAEVNRQFKERGVIPISPELGRQFFREELNYGSVDDVEIISGIYKQLPKRNFKVVNSPFFYNKNYPLINSDKIIKENNIWLTEKTISVENEPYLLDHCLDNQPVVPAAVAMELMAEFASTIWTDWQVVAVKNLQVLKGITLGDRQPVRVKLIAEIKTSKLLASEKAKSNNFLVAKVHIEDINKRKLYQAEIFLKQESWPNLLENINNLEQIKLLSPLDIKTTYPRYCFHGEKFQLINKIEHFGEIGATAIVNSSNPDDWLNYPQKNQGEKNWLFDPGLVDVALQMSLIWTGIYEDKGCLPAKFGKITRYKKYSPNQELKLVFRIINSNFTTVTFSAYYLDNENEIILALQNIEMTCSQALKRLTA